MSGTPPETPREQHDSLVGRTIAGKFLIERRLGAGAMGAVYRAQQTALERPVAIKVMHAELAADPTYAARFHREAKAVSRLDHPNLIHVHDYGQEPDGLLYIAMDYLDSRDLLTVLAEDWPLSLERIVDLLSQTLSGLAEAHEAGVLHRDLKPGNIMVLARKAEDGAPIDLVKVCDFGIAKFVEPTDPSKTRRAPERRKLTTGGLVIGTPEYMSPEQARGESCDVRSDLYAVGVILYQLLSGHLPFVGKTAIEVVFKAMHKEPDALDSHGVTVAPALDPICVKAMSRQPEDRYQSAREMRSALQAARAIVTQAAAPSLAQAPKGEDVRPPELGSETARLPLPPATEAPRRWLGGVLVSVAIAIGAAALVVESRRTHPIEASSPPPPIVQPEPSAEPMPRAPSEPVPSSRTSSALPETPPTPTRATSLLSVRPSPPESRQAVVVAPDVPAPASTAPTAAASAPTLAPSPALPSIASAVSAIPTSPSPLAAASPPPQASSSFNPGTARVELGRVKCNNAAVTSGGVSRTLGPLVARFTTCYRTALAQGSGDGSGAAGTLHLESDDEGYVTVARVTGASSASAARCIEGISRDLRLQVDTGAANVDVALIFKPL